MQRTGLGSTYLPVGKTACACWPRGSVHNSGLCDVRSAEPLKANSTYWNSAMEPLLSIGCSGPEARPRAQESPAELHRKCGGKSRWLRCWHGQVDVGQTEYRLRFRLGGSLPCAGAYE